MAVIQVATWRDYVDDLSPSFELSEKDALTKSIPRTTVTEQRAINSLTSKLGLGLERSSTIKNDTKTITTTEKTGAADEDSTETKNTETRSRGPGELPEFIANSAASPGSFADQPKDISKDPILHYTAATALYQEVKMLNRYVKDAALRSNTIPYIVRVQLQVLPYARNQPYDIYTLLSFFGSGKADKIRVVPLLVTDNLENALAERTSQTIRDLTLALSTLNSGLLGTFGLGRKTDVLNSILGNDTNSLLTVGRVTDNSISVRLGAARQATAGYAMLPRTHNITLLVMAPKELLDEETGNGERNAKIRIAAKWSARHALTGTTLREFAPSAFPTYVAHHLEKMTKEKLESEVIDKLIRHVYQNNPAAFCAELGQNKLKRGVRQRDVFVHIVERLQRQPTLGARFELPVLRDTELPDKTQTGLLLDNGSSKTSVTLRGGLAMRADEISGYLGVTLKDGSIIGFQSENSAVTNNGSSLNLNFPSLESWKVGELKKKGALLDGSFIEVHSKSVDRYKKDIPPLTEIYTNLMYKHAEAKEREYVDVSRTSVKVTTSSGTGSVDLHVKFDASDPNDLATQATFTVDGAEIDTVEKITPNTAIAVTSGAFSLSGDQSVRITLKNMEPGSSFTIKVQPKDSAGAKLGKEKPYLYSVSNPKS